MNLLRRILLWQALLWAAFGLMIVVAPGWLVDRVFDQPPLGEDAWLRLTGVVAIAMAGQMALVARRIEDLWWWSWSFVLLELGTSVVLLLNALFGAPEDAAVWPWWLLGAANIGVGALEVVALAQAGTERSAV